MPSSPVTAPAMSAPASASTAAALRATLAALRFAARDDPLDALGLSRALAACEPRVLAPPAAPLPAGARARRYVAVKLARALQAYFTAPGAPRLVPDVARFLRDSAADKAAGTDLLDHEETLAALGEIVLLVALHSRDRDSYVTAVFNLPADQQDLLATAVRRLLADEDHEVRAASPARASCPDQYDHREYDHRDHHHRPDDARYAAAADENDAHSSSDTFASPPRYAASPPHRRSAPARDHTTAPPDATTPVDGPPPGHAAPPNVLSENPRIAASSNVIEAAIAAPKPEESALRGKILILEQRLRDARGRDTPQPGVGTKRPAPDSSSPKPSTPELLALRARAAEADAAEAALQRVTARLESVRDARSRIEQLEAENAMLRDADMRNSTRLGILQSQLDASNARAETLVALSENLSSDLHQKGKELADAVSQNASLASKLDEANMQITSLLGSSNTPISRSKSDTSDSLESSEAPSTPAMNTDAASVVEVRRTMRSGSTPSPKSVDICDASPSRATPESSRASAPTINREAAHINCQVTSSDAVVDVPPRQAAAVSAPPVKVFDKHVASAAVCNELGVNMTWDDILDCVKGVVEAMREMDAAEAGGHDESLPSEFTQSEVSRPSNKRARESPSTDEYSAPPSNLSSATDDSFVRRKSSGRCSKVPTLQDFIDMDMRMEAAGSERDDDFDFAADQTNVKEVGSVFDGKSPGPSPSPSPRFDVQPVPPKRRPTPPSLPTVPEDYEGFVEHGISTSDTDSSQESSESPVSRSIPADSAVVATPEEEAARAPEMANSPPRVETRGLPSSPEFDTVRLGRRTVNSPHSSEASYDQTAREISANGNAPGSPRNGAANDDDARRSPPPIGMPYVPSGMSLPPQYSAVGIPLQSGEATIGRLIQELSDSREELCLVQTYASAKERECGDIRKELSLLINEVDSLLAERDARAEHESELVAEKERLIAHLQETLLCRTSELDVARGELEGLRQEAHELRRERNRLTEGILGANKKLSEATRQHSILSRSQEVEIARLTAQVEATQAIAKKLRDSVAVTGEVSEEALRERHGYYKDLMDTIRSEREAAEEARNESRRVARQHTAKLDEIHNTAVAAAQGRDYNVDISVRKSRKNTRGVAAFIRRVTQRSDPECFDTTFVMTPKPTSADLRAGGFPVRPIIPR